MSGTFRRPIMTASGVAVALFLMELTNRVGSRVLTTAVDQGYPKAQPVVSRGSAGRHHRVAVTSFQPSRQRGLGSARRRGKVSRRHKASA